jgi:hypothetical protein
MNLKSCQNCVFNPLQYGSVGGALGYCVEHELLLQDADHTTCGRLLRKDLQLGSAEAERARHEARFPLDAVVRLRQSGGHEPAAAHAVAPRPAPRGPAAGRREARGEGDAVLEVVADYGELHSKIESIAQLRRLPGARAAVARLSLGRAYVRRCRLRGGAWTSGLHQLWWAIDELEDPAAVTLSDLRTTEPAAPLSRQLELASWSIIMLRLTFIADVASNAGRAEPAVAALADLPEAAAAEASTSLTKLRRWIKAKGAPMARAALPWERYRALGAALHEAREPAA